MKLNDNSTYLTKILPRNIKRTSGIYFTPNPIVEFMCSYLKEIIRSKTIRFQTILEPSCGSCNFVKQLDTTFRNKQICGVECNKCIFRYMKKFTPSNNTFQIINKDFLKMRKRTFDIIIGNPPYARSYMHKYSKYHAGSGNLYIYFILKSLSMLNPNGIMCFLLPRSFLRTLNYSKVREFIYKNFNIIDIVDHDGKNFINTNINTISIYVQNSKPVSNDLFTITWKTPFDMLYTFNTKQKTNNIKNILTHSLSMNDMNFLVKSGNSNLVKGPLIIIDKCDYFDRKQTCQIRFKTHFSHKHITIDKNSLYIKHDYISFLKFLLLSFNDQRTKIFMRLYFQNEPFTLKEFMFILPIFTDLKYDLLNGFQIQKRFGDIFYKGKASFLKNETLPYIYMIDYSNGNKESMTIQELLLLL